MKYKILGILICTLLIAATVLPVAGQLDEKNNTSTRGIELVPVVDFIDPPLINLGGIPLALRNTGEGSADDITWKMEIIEEGGLFGGKLFNPKEEEGTFPSLPPDEYDDTKITLTGFGITTIYCSCTYTMPDITGCEVEFEVKQEWRDLGLMSVHLFFPSMQPDKDWIVIDDFTYFEDTKAEGVEFHVEGIRQMHNVRVNTGASSKSDDVVFLAACKFINGTARLEECWITKDIVEYEDAYWELELVDQE